MNRAHSKNATHPIMKKILFVCVENSCRSQMAEGFARILGKEKCIAFSAGSKPSGVVNTKAIASMHEIGYNLGLHTSKSVDGFGNKHFDYVITMGCGDACPFIEAKHHLDWNIPDPKNMSPAEFAEVRDLIGEMVGRLLGQM